MNAFDRLLLPENLYYAWLKAKRFCRNDDGYTNIGELAEFELDLEQNLLKIHRQFERGQYRLKKLRPLPRPKKLRDEGPIDRQYFHVALEDQVAWIALVNALGPELDKKMPPWSYGNRLYRPAWYEKGEQQESILEIGPYRHASGHIYRKFKHSWPLFRRHVALTARAMAARQPPDRAELDEPDQLALATASSEKLPYLMSDFWELRTGKEKESELYHATIDLEKFYPKLRTEAVIDGLATAGATDDPRMQNLLTDMVKFRLDISGMPEPTLANVEPPFLTRSVRGIPTGLFVAGFLANAAMLPVDIMADQKLRELRSIAHFRFVDDHAIIAHDFEQLCEWIIWYENLLKEQCIGASVNNKKYDPPSLSEWMVQRKRSAASSEPKASSTKKRHEALHATAMRDTRLDGKNPTKLMTKTLAQVSAIAATDIHILDDNDLEERLKMLEWLLLADIPEREIRPDTRAAFAAGQIAALAPVLIQEADGLVDAFRNRAILKSQAPDPTHATAEAIARHQEEVEQFNELVGRLSNEHDKAETRLLRHCFDLLLQAFREHVGKARLFYRLHQYCRVTGYQGLASLAAWIKEARIDGKSVWADYYAGLSLQIMAQGILVATRTLDSSDALRSDIKSALQHIEDISQLDTSAFLVHSEKEAWFHAIARQEFGIALFGVTKTLAQRADTSHLSQRLMALSNKCVTHPLETWATKTGRALGAWAHFIENELARNEKPSPAWHAFAKYFAFEDRTDAIAARRYPEWLPKAGWEHLLRAADPPHESDSGWLCEVIGNDERKRAAAASSGRVALTRAARSIAPPPDKWVTLSRWTEAIRTCSPFDPRRSEWTALEITGQLVSQVTKLEGDEEMLDRLQPNNVLVPRTWIDHFERHQEMTEISWEEWRQFSQSEKNDKAKLREPSTSLIDYRYAPDNKTGLSLDNWDRRMIAVGRLLLGLLFLDYSAPRLWNLRGNEKVFRFPNMPRVEALAISSPTTLIIESCLGARTAETRSISRAPSLFGWRDGQDANDAKFDPPPLFGSTKLLEAIKAAQKVLTDNQCAVTMNQPRQLIPFRLYDFSVNSLEEDAALGENDDQG